LTLARKKLTGSVTRGSIIRQRGKSGPVLARGVSIEGQGVVDRVGIAIEGDHVHMTLASGRAE